MIMGKAIISIIGMLLPTQYGNYMYYVTTTVAIVHTWCALAVYSQQWNVCATLASMFYRWSSI